MPNLDLFIFVDALGWRLVEERGFLNDLFPQQSPCETVFGYSSTCDPTILTGAAPDEHGHFSFFVKSEGESPFKGLGALSILPHRLAAYHRIRNRMSRWMARAKGYTGYFQLYSVPFFALPHLDYTEKYDIYEPGGILGGQETIFELWKRSGKSWMRSDWRRNDEENFAEAERLVEKGEIELGYLFTGQLDGIMHRFGTSGPEVDQGWKWFEDKITRLYKKAEPHYDKVRFYIFSDHGMADTTATSDMMLRWNRLGWKYGRDYVAVWDSTMARFWFLNDDVRKKGTEWLTEQTDGSVVSEELLRQWRCWFPDQTYGELFYLLPPGKIFVPSFLNQSTVPGMHGYDPNHVDSTAAWITNADDAPIPQGLGDIYQVMAFAANR